MTLNVLSGLIRQTQIEGNFNDKQAAIQAVNSLAAKPLQFDHRVIDLSSATIVPLLHKDFTAPDDMKLVTMGFTLFNTALVAKTITMTLKAITVREVEVSRYLNDQVVTCSESSSTVSNKESSRYVPVVGVILVKGITYRISFSSSSASPVDSVFGFVLAEQIKRYR